MKNIYLFFIIILIWNSVLFSGDIITKSSLPPALKIELYRLEETWNILNYCAEKIWTGWNNYKDVPFLYSYPNGMELLVGHPSPLDDFQLVPDITISGKKVYLNQKNVVAVDLIPPITGGGGPINYGKEKRVRTISIHLDPPTLSSSPSNKTKSFPEEEQILINIHELFHCYQYQIIQNPIGNLQYNTDANYAIYAEIEGIALEKAFLEPDNQKAKEYLKDFIVARKLKRYSMTESQQKKESFEDFMEGTAVYAETMALELIKNGYKPLITQEQDPFYTGFKDIQSLFEKKLKSLRKYREQTMDSRGKCYDYGCFQALLLNRFVPGWQKIAIEKQQFQDEIIANFLNLSQKQIDETEDQLKTKYDYITLYKKHTTLINKRDQAYKMMLNRSGRKYIINFKPTHEFLNIKSRGEEYTLGLIRMYPQGIEKLQLHDIFLEGLETPILQDQLYYLKWIDTETITTEKGYTIQYAQKEGDNTYIDAVFSTKGFVLKAPKIQIKDTPNRVKVTILSKVKEKK